MRLRDGSLCIISQHSFIFHGSLFPKTTRNLSGRQILAVVPFSVLCFAVHKLRVLFSESDYCDSRDGVEKYFWHFHRFDFFTLHLRESHSVFGSCRIRKSQKNFELAKISMSFVSVSVSEVINEGAE